MSRIREKLIAFLYSPAFSAFVIIAILLRFILAALPDAVFLVVQSFSAPIMSRKRKKFFSSA